MHFQVLGPLQVHGADAIRPVRGGRPRVLLHLLLMQRRLAMPVDTIADRLWGEELPADAANALHQLVSYLRRALGEEGRPLLTTSVSGYRLDVADDAVDAWRFERHVEAAARLVPQGTVDAAQEALVEVERATTLWRGEPFPESAGNAWATAEIARLKEAYLQVQEARLEALLTLGRHREVVMEAQSLAAAYPLRERFHRQWSLALYRSGRQGEALEVHRSVRTLLAQELGLDPGPELRELERAILNQDDSLSWRPPTDQVAVNGSSRAQVVADDEARGAAAPPPRPAPVMPTSLVGRDASVADARDLVAPGRLVTILGPGGVGKTRVALAVAEGLDVAPVWFVDLGDVVDPSLVAGTVAGRLHLGTSYPHDPAERLVDAFAGAEGLLLLDTCEHVADHLAPLLSSLLAAAPGLRVIATSRRPIGIAAERVYHLEPLPVPGPGRDGEISLQKNPAVQLFLARAEGVRCGRPHEDIQLRDVGVIVSMLGGLPLAIELAAAHGDVLSVDQIRVQLERSINALPARSLETAPRQRSLRAVVESSLVLLSDAEAAFFARLGVFAASFDLQAAADVADVDGATALQLVSALVRHSLLIHEGSGRYRLLDPIRYLAQELLTDSGEEEMGRERHAVHVEQRTADAASRIADADSQPGALRDLERLLPDARAVIASSIERGETVRAGRLVAGYAWFWTLQGMADEGLHWMKVLRRLEIGDKQVRADLLRSLALLANPLGQLELAREACLESAQLYREIDDCHGLAYSLLALGIAQWAMGDHAGAAASHDEARNVTVHEPGSWLHCSAHVLRARTAIDAGEPDAEARVDAALTLAQETGERQLLGLALSLRARQHLSRGDWAPATLVAKEALRVWREVDYREGEMSALNLLGRLLVHQGEPAEGEARLWQALAVARRAHHPGALCETLESLALAAAATGRNEHAYLLLRVSSAHRGRIGNPVAAGMKRELDALATRTRDALGAAAATVAARASLTSLDDLVDELLAARSVGAVD